jgi:DNA-binding XRE family transcriptional regulator
VQLKGEIIVKIDMKNFDDLKNELKEQDEFEYFVLELAGKLKAARDRKGLSQRELSEITGTPQKTISRIENGKDVPQLQTLFRLFKVLDLELKIVSV